MLYRNWAGIPGLTFTAAVNNGSPDNQKPGNDTNHQKNNPRHDPQVDDAVYLVGEAHVRLATTPTLTAACTLQGKGQRW
jgi:hypothetical protein